MLTLTFSTWVIPFFISLLALLSAWRYSSKQYGMFSGSAGCFGFLIAVIVALISWLIYALLR
jgi:hypothetical protein